MGNNEPTGDGDSRRKRHEAVSTGGNRQASPGQLFDLLPPELQAQLRNLQRRAALPLRGLSLQGIVHDFLPAIEALLRLHASHLDICELLADLGVAKDDGTPYATNTFSRALSREYEAFRTKNRDCTKSSGGARMRRVAFESGASPGTANDGERGRAENGSQRQLTDADGKERQFTAERGNNLDPRSKIDCEHSRETSIQIGSSPATIVRTSDFDTTLEQGRILSKILKEKR